jgi:hypothetical protein
MPLTSIHEIQAIVLYNRKVEVTSRVLGLLIELYNSTSPRIKKGTQGSRGSWMPLGKLKPSHDSFRCT